MSNPKLISLPTHHNAQLQQHKIEFKNLRHLGM